MLDWRVFTVPAGEPQPVLASAGRGRVVVMICTFYGSSSILKVSLIALMAALLAL